MGSSVRTAAYRGGKPPLRTWAPFVRPRLHLLAYARGVPPEPVQAPVTVKIDGLPVRVPAGTSIAAAIWNAGGHGSRRSIGGEPRAALCGMGICYECRVTVDGVPHERGCMISCVEGMDIRTAARLSNSPAQPPRADT
ncbi:MAG: (2Fe-2S)-binding protein [Phycisphaerales bacterium]|nr:(2Fe-2S)-binding protein [Phycisphaerales bacterium]